MADNFQIPATAGPVTLRAKEISAGVYAVMKYVPDGYDETKGAKADAPVSATQDTTAVTMIALLKGLFNVIGATSDAAATAGGAGSAASKLRLMTSQMVDLDTGLDNLNALVATEGTQGNIYGSIGTTTDAAATAGGTGTLHAKARVTSASIGAVGDAAVTNPASSASLIAATKGLLSLLGTTLGVGGNVAAAATDSGNPVKIGGKYNTTLPTLTNGQRGDLQLDDRSRAIVALPPDAATQTTLGALNTSFGTASDAVLDPDTDPDGTAQARLRTLIQQMKELVNLADSEIPPGDFHIGQVGGHAVVKEFVPTLDTSAYASGDILFTTVNAMDTRVVDYGSVVNNITITDYNNLGPAMTLFFLKSNVSFGANNSACSISTANLKQIVKTVKILSTDWTTEDGKKVVNVPWPTGGGPFHWPPATGTADCYLTARLDEAKTYTNADAMTFNFGVQLD